MTEADMNRRLTPDLERTLQRYVRGDMDETLRLELEELLITDPDAFEALGVVEDELIEEYLDGAGTEADRQDFERHFLTSPQRVAMLRFARALSDRASRGMAVEPSRPQRSVLRPLRWQPAWIGLAAALTVSLAGNFWLGLSRPSPGALIEAPTRGGDGAARLQELQDRLVREQRERSRAEARATTLEDALRRSRASVATFALAAGVLRAGGSIQRVDVPADAIVVRLRLELAGADYPLYRTALLDAQGDELWTASKLKAESEADETVVVLALPVALLPRGDYQVRLSGLAERGEPEAVATYAFRVNAR